MFYCVTCSATLYTRTFTRLIPECPHIICLLSDVQSKMAVNIVDLPYVANNIKINERKTRTEQTN